MYVNNEVGTGVLIAALSIVTLGWKQPLHACVGEWIDVIVYME